MSAKHIQKKRPGKAKKAASVYKRPDQKIRKPTPDPRFTGRGGDAALMAATERAAEALDAIIATVGLPQLMAALRDGQQGQPAGTDYDPMRQGRPAWCETHERDVTRCHESCIHHDQTIDHCRRNGWGCYRTLGCTGVPAPERSDPTGDAGSSHDKAREDEDQARHCLLVIVAAVQSLDRIAIDHHHHGHAELMDTPAVTACAEPNCEDPSDRKRGRCAACYRWVLRWEAYHPNEQAPPVPAAIIEARLAARHERALTMRIDPKKHNGAA